MSQTVRDLINGSLRLLGVISEGESPSAQTQNDAFNALNDMIDSWSSKSLLIPNKVRETFALTSGQQTYTFGTGGNFNSTRPQLIENALIQVSGTNPVAEIPINIINQDQFASIVVKGTQSSLPLFLYNDNAYPLTSVNLWPVPSITTNLVLYSWKPLAEFTSLSQVMALAPGYNRAIRFNLAVDLAPEFGKSAPPEVLAIAEASVGDIKRMNTKPQYLTIDAELIGKDGRFNWLTGDTV